MGNQPASSGGCGAAPNLVNRVQRMRFTLLTVIESIIGLVVEVVFVAMVRERLFGKG
jgi:hypothetical protein